MKLKRIVTRVLLGVVALVVLGALGLVGIIAYDTVNPSQVATDFTNTTFPGPDGIMLNAYLAQQAAPGPHPAVLLIHEFYGINEDVIRKADLLAEQGYTVLAVDAYRGQTTQLVPRAIYLVLSTPQEQVTADMQAAAAYLESVEGVDPARVGAVGFCFGGTQVMWLGVNSPDLRASVIFYGSGPIMDSDALGSLGENGPVLGIFGEEDGSIPLEEVRGFGAAMDARGIDNTITVYPGVGHAFVNTEAIRQPGPAQDAWNEMLNFLAVNLK